VGSREVGRTDFLLSREENGLGRLGNRGITGWKGENERRRRDGIAICLSSYIRVLNPQRIPRKGEKDLRERGEKDLVPLKNSATVQWSAELMKIHCAGGGGGGERTTGGGGGGEDRPLFLNLPVLTLETSRLQKGRRHRPKIGF